MRIAIVGLSDESAARFAQPLMRLGHDTRIITPADALTVLPDLAVDIALIEFAASSGGMLATALQHKPLTDRLPLVAIFGPDELIAYESTTLAEDFVLWPALPAELEVRLRIAVRRRVGTEPEHILRFGDLTIDLANYRVTVAGQQVELTFKEYELLRFLASNRDKVFTREALLNRVWGYDYYGGARTVDVHIRRLRAKIENADRTYIETIRNVGYRFREGP